MAFEPGIKLRAIELYLEMHSVPKVHEKICSEYINKTKFSKEVFNIKQ